MAGGGAYSFTELKQQKSSEQLRCNSWKWKTFAPPSVSVSFLPAEAKPYSDYSPENSRSDSRQRWDLVISVNTLAPCSHGRVAGRCIASDCHKPVKSWARHCLDLVEFFLPPVTTASDEQLKLIIQKFARVGLALYKTISLSQPLLPLPKHCSLYWGGRLVKSCQSLEDACN